MPPKVVGFTDAFLAQFDFDGDALVDIDGPHHWIHRGWAFSINIADATFQKNGEMGVIFTTPAGDKEIHMVVLLTVDTKSMFDILRAPTIDVANYPSQFQTPINRNENSDTASIISSVRAVPVVNEVGIILDGDTTPITANGTVIHTEVIGGAKNKDFGDGIRSVSERVLKADTIHYFRVVGDNTGTDNLGLSMELVWYEKDSIL